MRFFEVFLTIVVFVLLDLTSVSTAGSNAIAPYYVKTRSIICYGNPDLLVNITCKLKPLNWENSIATMDSDLVGVIKNASLRLEFFKYTNQFRPFLINVTYNLCQMLDAGHGTAYGRMVMNLFARFTSINHTCPYTGHLAAYGIYLDASFVPFFVPSGKYKLVFSFYEGWPFVHIGTVEVIGSVIDAKEVTRTRARSRPKPDRRVDSFNTSIKGDVP